MDFSKLKTSSQQVEPISDLTLDIYAISPDWDNYADFTNIDVNLNKHFPYFSLDVYEIEGNTLTYKGRLFKETANMGPGYYGYAFWMGTVMLNSEYIQLEEGHYAIIPRVGLGEEDLLLDKLIDVIIDLTPPVSELSEPSVTAVDDVGTIHGRVISDLMIDALGDYSGITVSVSPSHSSSLYYYGTFAENGEFSVKVPLKYGLNRFYVTVHDAAFNGRQPIYTVDYVREKEPTEPAIAAVASKIEVEIGETFDIAINFSRVKDLYAAQFSLTYDSALIKGSTGPSAVLGNHQQQANAGAALITSEKTVELGNGRVRTDYIVSLVGDITGYSGAGTFATLHFSSKTAGTFRFDLSQIQSLNSDAEEIGYESVKNTAVTVTRGQGEQKHTISGHVTAEAFSSSVDYSNVWYNGTDMVHKVAVVAIDSNGAVAANGEVAANGSYTLKVPNGTFQVRVVVPGHLSAETSIEANRDVTINFGPLEAGDVDGNQKIGLKDLQLAAKQFGKSKGSGWLNAIASSADINRDNEIDLLDISYIIANYKLA
ncbi:hypothetical protein [Paenibacillus sp. KS-LC4]|uniref:hypothetical protein n=1 Tax=Paenibacillus sp. KS-LC4 TaxID=2979727 RepID=UPI0030CD1234